MNLDVRMKLYEEATRTRLPVRMPVILRLDGKCFHTLTRSAEKPFDSKLRNALVWSAQAVIQQEIPARYAFAQSDEISMLLVDYNRFDSQQWFDGIVQKMVSVAAAMMSVEFSKRYDKTGYFDCRAFAVPERDVKNYFIWRQQDCMRNAVSMIAQSQFSHVELQGQGTNDMVRMLADHKGITMPMYPEHFRMGTSITRYDIGPAPRLSTNQKYLDQFLTVEEE